MSMFVCAECGNFADSDDGCEEAPASKYFPAHQLLCVDCVDTEETPLKAYIDQHKTDAEMFYGTVKIGKP